MANVFISFIHEEVGYAKAVQGFVGMILGEDVKPFLSSDQFQIYAGENWLDRIKSELAPSNVVLLMLSPLSVGRPWVNFEAGAAWITEKTMIPVCYGGLEKNQLPKPYSSLQAVDLTHSDDHEYLAMSVAHHLGLDQPLFLNPDFIRGIRALAGAEGGKTEQKNEANLSALKLFRDRLEKLKKPVNDLG